VGHADDGQGTDLRGNERQARNDRGHTPAAQEEVFGVFLLPPEDIGDDKEQQDRPGDDEPVEPAERSGKLLGNGVFDDPSSFPGTIRYSKRISGGIAKASGLDDGPTHTKAAIVKGSPWRCHPETESPWIKHSSSQ
jgi:hypothetical protein